MIDLIMKKNCSVTEKLLLDKMFEFLQFSKRKVFLYLHLLHDIKIIIFE